MLERAAAGAELVLASWKMQNVSRRRRALSAAAGLVVRTALGVEAKTVSSFFRVYRASALKAAYELHGDSLIRESGFACKAEILIKLDRMRVRIAEVPVSLDWSRREGESKMRVLPTVGGYARMMMRQASAKERA
jgi:dolichol-phosphate mannosyltransferase